MQFQGMMEISTSQFPLHIPHPQIFANPSRNYENPFFLGAALDMWRPVQTSWDSDLEVGIWSPASLLLNRIQRIYSWNILYCTHNASNSSDFPQIQSPDPAQINSVVLIASTKAEENITI